ncbi:hypothetical protein QCA50_008358 [Cerrena zonata]|uniref:Fungal-type protein kinase domain-containing protein n=1 Tax=Cerrena zonata TaxID=2478898 RepID=A0AAW0G3S6_9APHY
MDGQHKNSLSCSRGMNLWISAIRAAPLQTSVENKGLSSGHRGQVITYAWHQFSRQFRNFLFVACIFGPYCRIMRWDRAGCIISERFNYQEDSQLLADFFWRYAHSTDEQRGHDPSVSWATDEEDALLMEAIEAYKKRVAPRKVDYLDSTVKRPCQAYKLIVHDCHMDKATKERIIGETQLIVKCPFSETQSPCGRATKGFAAYHLGEHRLVFLKDCWRTDDERTTSEAKLYELLRDAGVDNLPINIAMGDVLTDDECQKTLTTKFGASTPPLRQLTHHRLVQELAFPLSCALSSEEMIHAIYDTIECIGQAYCKANILHRDISALNIMIRDLDPSLPINANGSRRSVGILNDWDHGVCINPRLYKPHTSRTVCLLFSLPRPIFKRHFFQGTWFFMSIKLLQHPGLDHEIQDDIESCFWVLLYIAFHHYKQKNEKVNFTLNFFSENESRFNEDDGRYHHIGGVGKTSLLINGNLQRTIRWVSNPLTTVIHKFADTLRDYNMKRPVHTSNLKVQLEDTAYAKIHKFFGNTNNILKFLKEALDRADWPILDRLDDQLKPQTESISERQHRDRQLKSTVQASHDSISNLTTQAGPSDPSPSQSGQIPLPPAGFVQHYGWRAPSPDIFQSPMTSRKRKKVHASISKKSVRGRAKSPSRTRSSSRPYDLLERWKKQEKKRVKQVETEGIQKLINPNPSPSPSPPPQSAGSSRTSTYCTNHSSSASQNGLTRHTSQSSTINTDSSNEGRRSKKVRKQKSATYTGKGKARAT